MKEKKQAEVINWFAPLLDALRALGGSGKPKEVATKIAELMQLDDNTLNTTLKSGVNRFENQVAWARQYLCWEGLVSSLQKGTWTLTAKGRETNLTENQSRAIFTKWNNICHQNSKNKAKEQSVEEEICSIDAGYSLLDKLKELSPSGFERICQELLREHGFQNVEVTGQSHDGGIDGYGVLEVNPFVHLKVMFQCKRYGNTTVSRAQVGDFRNAVMGRAEKGIILTTGSFSKDAEREASREGVIPIELIDGEQLVRMFEMVGLGVTPKTVYEIDINYFEKFKD